MPNQKAWKRIKSFLINILPFNIQGLMHDFLIKDSDGIITVLNIILSTGLIVLLF